MDNKKCTCLQVHRVTDDKEGWDGVTYIAHRMCDYCRDKERKELIRAQQLE